MQLTYRFNYYKNLDGLHYLYNASKNLYNQANYLINQHYKKTKKYLGYQQVDKQIKTLKNLEGQINYKQLKAQWSQQILRQLDKNWKSYFKSLKVYKTTPKKFKGLPKPPKYIHNLYNLIILTNQSAKIKDNKIYLTKNLIIKIPKYKDKQFDLFNSIRIIPKKTYCVVEIIYTTKEQLHKINNNVASIDLGVNNLATMISNKIKNPIIFNGRQIKAKNQWYNKKIAYLKSIRDKMKKKETTKQLDSLNTRRNNQINDIMHKVSRSIVDKCNQNDIGTLVVGLNKNWKDSIKLGNKTNQTFVQIPYQSLINKLVYKCKLNGIKCITNEESYTSKIDHLVNESMKHQKHYLGKRIHRGLFKSSSGVIINSDVNGALGIVRKVVDENQFIGLVNSGNWLMPIKIRDLYNIQKQCQPLNKIKC